MTPFGVLRRLLASSDVFRRPTNIYRSLAILYILYVLPNDLVNSTVTDSHYVAPKRRSSWCVFLQVLVAVPYLTGASELGYLDSACRPMQCQHDAATVHMGLDSYVYPHALKTGGTTLSLLLSSAAGTDRIIPGSGISQSFDLRYFCDVANRSSIGHRYSASWLTCPSLPSWVGDKIAEGSLTYHRLCPGCNRSGSDRLRIGFGHMVAEHLSVLFPRAKLLLLVRDPFDHRLSWYNERKSPSTRSHSHVLDWMRSSTYSEEMRGYQMRFNRLGCAQQEDSAKCNDVEPRPAEAAKALIHNQQVWLGPFARLPVRGSVPVCVPAAVQQPRLAEAALAAHRLLHVEQDLALTAVSPLPP